MNEAQNREMKIGIIHWMGQDVVLRDKETGMELFFRDARTLNLAEKMARQAATIGYTIPQIHDGRIWL